MTQPARVIYNQDCPVCAHEIGHYRAYAEARALPLRFDDLNATDLAALGLTEEAAARRLHLLKDGQLLSGIEAFAALWAEMPRYAWAGRLVLWPGIRPLANFGYERLLAPVIYARHLRRKRLGKTKPAR